MLNNFFYLLCFSVTFVPAGFAAPVDSASSQSASADLKSSPFSGPYVGIAGGYGASRANFQTSYASPVYNADYPSRSVCFRGPEGGILAGYGQFVRENIYVGLEASYNISRAEGGARLKESVLRGPLNLLTVKFNTSFHQKDYFTVAARFGYSFENRFLPFVKIGWANSNFAGKILTNSVRVLNAVDLDLGQGSLIDRRFNAVYLAGGMDIKLGCGFSLGLEASYAPYRQSQEKKFVTTVTAAQAAQIAATAGAAGLPAAGLPAAGQQIETTVKTKISPPSRAFRLRLIYNF